MLPKAEKMEIYFSHESTCRISKEESFWFFNLVDVLAANLDFSKNFDLTRVGGPHQILKITN